MSKLVQNSEIHFSVISPSEKRKQDAIKEAARKAELARAEAKRRAAQKAAKEEKKAKEAAELAAKNKAQSIKRKKTIYTLIEVVVIIVIILLCIKLSLFLYDIEPALCILSGVLIVPAIFYSTFIVSIIFDEIKDNIK